MANTSVALSSIEAKRKLAAALVRKKLSEPKHFPLSAAQQRLWFLDQLTPQSSAYNVPYQMRLKGQLSVDAMSKSLNEIVRRHAVLRTRFVSQNGEPMQEVLPELTVPLEMLDLSHEQNSSREDLVRRCVREECVRGFDLEKGPLLRVKLIRMKEEEHVLVVSMHHIVSDGWSLGVLVKEFGVLYEA
ncbi:MAG TPA: condensation domain-containing protein, partial [Candidatus Acidoferrales bacterium]|nr:condensation domain-containing protein [Candidatus Acidoferrales bacterium]